ncbi:hypothetical protein GCM10028833_29750 [Glycomyces tarimensis]
MVTSIGYSNCPTWTVPAGGWRPELWALSSIATAGADMTGWASGLSAPATVSSSTPNITIHMRLAASFRGSSRATSAVSGLTVVGSTPSGSARPTAPVAVEAS